MNARLSALVPHWWLGLGAITMMATTGCEARKSVVVVEREVLVGQTDSGTTSSTGTTVAEEDRDGDGYGADDCDDDNPDVNPGTVESCNGIDDDCDGVVDDVGAPPSWYPDRDGDGYGVVGSDRYVGCDGPDGYAVDTGDCDDTRADVYPGAAPICEVGVDGDCDGSVDFVDADGDGHLSCDDCDDTNDAVNPEASEVCNGLDDNCDGVVDENGAVGSVAYYVDADGDGWGDPDAVTMSCNGVSGSVLVADDCDDSAAAVNPSAEEVCDEIDNDCDLTVDEADAADASLFYEDGDGDGYGDAGSIVKACDAPSGFVATDDDCDDRDASINPAATEVCGGGDEDCDGLVDDADGSVTGTSIFYEDADGDGYGDPTVTAAACDAPTGFVSDATDCDDSAEDAYPGAPEYCDELDNNCDGTVDEDSALDAATWYLDSDGDGWGSSTTHVACEPPSRYTSVSGDCDDSARSVYPTASETWYDGVDADCAGDSDYDADGDGYDSDNYGGTDCNDRVATVYPGAPETWYDGIDADCAGDSDYDADGDGYRSDDHSGPDCDDADGAVFPGATDSWYDGVDQDCDGRSDFDADEDGFDFDVYGGTDCDDGDELIHPYAWEDDSDGVDNDCDGFSDATDPDVVVDIGLGEFDDGEALVGFSSGFTFPFCGGSYSKLYLNGNGLISFSTSTGEFSESVFGLTSSYAPAIAVFWDDFDLSDNADSNAWAIDYGDAVGIYFRNAEEYVSSTSSDFAVILFDDGQLMWSFESMSARDGLVGWACGTGTGSAVDFSVERLAVTEALPSIGQGTEDAIYELFTSSDPMDLGGRTVWACATAGRDNDGDGWTDACGDPDDSSAAVTP